MLPLPSASAATDGPGRRRHGEWQRAPRTGGVIAFLGDDWTTGSGASSKSKRFSTLLAKQLGLTERNFGADGTGYAKATATDGTYDSRVADVVKAKPQRRRGVRRAQRRRRLPARPPSATSTRLFSTLHDKLPDAVVIAVEPFWGDSDKPAELGPVASAVKSEVTADGGHYLAIDDPIHNHPSFMADASDPNDKGNAAIADGSGRPGAGADQRLTGWCRGLAARAPHHQRRRRTAARDEFGVRVVELGGELGDPALQRVDLRLEFDDPLDAGEVDALVLGEPLHLAQQRDVAGGVAPPAAAVRPGVTSPSRSYWRRVCACMPASSAATEMTKTGASSGSSLGMPA